MKSPYSSSAILLLLATPLVVHAECYESSVSSPTPLMGNHNEIVTLQDKSVWRIQSAYEYLYEYRPDVLICPDLGIMFVEDSELDVVSVGKRANAQPKSDNSKIIRSTVDDDWEGWDGETVIVLTNGQVWQQDEYHYEYSYAYMPDVIILKIDDRWHMRVEDSDEWIAVKPLQSTIIQSRVDDEWEGWDGETVVVLTNGQVWRQDEYHYEYSYAYMPDVIILKIDDRWHMRVEDSDEWVAVSRLQ